MEGRRSKTNNDREPTANKTRCNGCAKVGPVDRSNNSPAATRTHEGWKLQWTEPKKGRDLVKAVVRGPFPRPKLVTALPYVVLDSCKSSCVGKIDPARKFRSGIPDPWLEYLSWKEREAGNTRIANRDIRSTWEYVRYTDFVWTKKGLALLQGIPDPWKIDEYCACEETINNEQKNKKRRSSVKETNKDDGKYNKRKNSKSSVKETNKDDGKDKKRKKSKLIQTDTLQDELKEASDKVKNKLRPLKSLEKMNQRLSELTDELKLKATEKENRILEVEKFTRSRENQRQKRNKNILSQHYPIVLKEKKSSQREKDDLNNYKGKKKQRSETKQPSLNTKYVANAESFQPEKRTSSSFKQKKRSSSSFQSCDGKCGRTNITKAKIKDDLKYPCGCSKDESSNTSTARSTYNTEDLNKFIDEINTRIKITTEALDAPDYASKKKAKDLNVKSSRQDESNRRSSKTPRNSKTKRLSFQDREKGGGERSINSQKSQLLFEKIEGNARDEDKVEILNEGRKIVSEFAVPAKASFETSIIASSIRTNESFDLKDRYQKNSSQKPNSDPSDNIEELIVESLSDSE